MSAWEKSPPVDRYDHIGRVIMTKTSTIEQVGEVLSMSLDSHGTRPEGQIVAIRGKTRDGKTTACKVFMERQALASGGTFDQIAKLDTEEESVESADFVTIYEGKQRIRPIIRICVAPSPTYRGLLWDTILAIAGETPPLSTAHGKLLKLLIKQIRKQKIRLIIFDEAHRVTRPGHTTYNALAADVFSTLAKQTRVEIALVGREDIDSLFASNDELNEMCEMRIEVKAPEYPEDEPKSEYYRLIRAFQANMPFDKACNIATVDVVKALHKSTKGSPGATSLLLQLATKYAIAKKHSTVNGYIIGKALETYRGIKGTENPFLKFGVDGPVDPTEVARNP